MDLPCDDDAAGADRYAEVVMEAVGHVAGPVTLVGHSLGGLTIPIVAARRPVDRLIFVAAMLPLPGVSLNEQRRNEPGMLFPYVGGRDGLRERFYNTCTNEDADFAMSRLRRQSLTPFEELSPLEKWPGTPSSYVVCSEDRACDPSWSRRAARARLMIDPIEMIGTGHSPFLDRPDELAAILVREATR